MKKFKYLILFVLPLLGLTACDESNEFSAGEEPTFGWVVFSGNSTTTSATNSLRSVTIPIEFTAPINKQDLVVNYSLSSVDGNVADIIDNLTGSTVISADTNTGSIVLELDEDTATTVASNDQIIFDVQLTSASRGVTVGIGGEGIIEHRVELVCDLTLDIGGMYSVTTNYGYHDFLPSFNPHTEDMEIVDNGDGTFFVQDFSGGLYNGGPYSGAYGTGPTSMDVTFTNSCRGITWSGQTDPWGDILPQEDGVNEINLDTGVITISWTCTGFGENGVSVYTPL